MRKLHVVAWRPAVVVAMIASGVLPGWAQEKPPRPDRLLRIVPLGEAPPFEFQVVGGQRVQKEPPRGSIPPREVQLGDAEGKDVGGPIRLGLDRVSASLPVAAGSARLHEVGPDGRSERPWVTLEVPDGTRHAMALLWRDPARQSWETARSLVLTDDVASFPAGMIRFVNVSPWSVEIERGGKKIPLPAGKVVTQRGNQAGEEPVKIALQDRSGNWRAMFHQVVPLGAGERSSVLVYRADGQRPRRPVKVLVLTERAVLPEPPKAGD